MDLGGGEDEFYVSGRFFQCFQEGVEGLGREHVDFVDDVDFEFSTGWGVRDAVAQVLDLPDATVRGAVDLEDVEAASFLDFLADIVVGVEVCLRAVGTVEGFGEDAGGGGFSDAPGADKEKGVGEAAFGDGVGEGADNMFLADQFGKGAGAVFAGENEVTHKS